LYFIRRASNLTQLL